MPKTSTLSPESRVSITGAHKVYKSSSSQKVQVLRCPRGPCLSQDMINTRPPAALHSSNSQTHSVLIFTRLAAWCAPMQHWTRPMPQPGLQMRRSPKPKTSTRTPYGKRSVFPVALLRRGIGFHLSTCAVVKPSPL
jgi:hypothetical protein